MPEEKADTGEAVSEDIGSLTVESGDGGEGKLTLPSPLEPFVHRGGLRRLFSLFPDDKETCFRHLTPTHLRLYITLAGRTEAGQTATGVSSRTQLGFEPEMVFVPAGEFLMGSTADEVKQGLAKENETPQHAVNLPAYEIGRYPITNQEYKAFVEATGHPPPRHWENGQFPDELADHPVTSVSWDDAVVYCHWLSKASGRNYRLPTEGEWERAARGPYGRRYPWGNEFDQTKCNTKEGESGATTPVGQYSPGGDSPAGCADMAGNVWEWTDSDFEAYPGSSYPDKNYGQGLKVLRGGSFANYQDAARAASRNRYYPDDWNRSLGFRVAAAPASQPSEI